jgi:chromosome segregation ATPase
MVDGPVEPASEGPYTPDFGTRLSRVEVEVRDIKDTLGDLKTMVARMDARLDAVLPHLATKADLAEVQRATTAELADVRTGLADVRTEVAQVRSEVAQVRTEVAEVKTDVAQVKTEVSQVKTDVAQVSTEVAHVKTEISQVRTEVAQVRSEVAESRLTAKADIAELRLATTTEISQLRVAIQTELGEVKDGLADVRVALAEKPSKTYMWGILAALLTAYACGLAALAVLK